MESITEINQRENVTLEYETNKNWINFRDKKKQLETKNKEILLKLNQSEDQYKKVISNFEEKNSQSYNYFEIQQQTIVDKKELVF